METPPSPLRSLQARAAEGYAYAMKPYEDAAAEARLAQSQIADRAETPYALGGTGDMEANSIKLANELVERRNTRLGIVAVGIYNKRKPRDIVVDETGKPEELAGKPSVVEGVMKFTDPNRAGAYQKAQAQAAEYKETHPQSSQTVERLRKHGWRYTKEAIEAAQPPGASGMTVRMSGGPGRAAIVEALRQRREESK